MIAINKQHGGEHVGEHERPIGAAQRIELARRAYSAAPPRIFETRQQRRADRRERIMLIIAFTALVIVWWSIAVAGVTDDMDARWAGGAGGAGGEVGAGGAGAVGGAGGAGGASVRKEQ